MTEWTEPCGKERAKVAEAKGVKFCCFPVTERYYSVTGRGICCVSRGLRRGKDTKTGYEVESVWFVNIYEPLDSGDSKNILHVELLIVPGKEGEAKEAAFELAAGKLLDVQKAKS